VTKEDLRLALDNLALKPTVHTGVMIAAAVSILRTLDALTDPHGALSIPVARSAWRL
jgi:uncharacterized protein YaaW (UPF0174 family)